MFMMEAVKAGGDRQKLHEAIRVHSMEAGKKVKMEGGDNDLLERLKRDPLFVKITHRIDAIVNPKAFIGRAPEQTEEFIKESVYPVLERFAEEMKKVATEKITV